MQVKSQWKRLSAYVVSIFGFQEIPAIHLFNVPNVDPRFGIGQRMSDKKKPFNAGIQKACPCCEGIMLLLNKDKSESDLFDTFVCPNCGLDLKFHNRRQIDYWLSQQ
jgi:hypothetical protein